MDSAAYANDAGVGIITLIKSIEGNRLSLGSLTDLTNALNAAVEDAEVRVIILRSNGPVFSLGLDFTTVLQKADGYGSEAVMDAAAKAVRLYRGILYRLFTCGKPVIAVVQGDVKAGGVGLMCASDVVIASGEATVELSEVIFGLIPANVLPYLLQTRVSISRARYLILTAKLLTAGMAANFGLIDEVYPSNKMERAVKKICKQFFRSSPEALARTKAFTLRMLESSFPDRGALAENEILNLLTDENVLKGIKSFQTGDLPEWFSGFSPEGPLVLGPE